MLVYSRVLIPSSKKASFENMDNYFLDFSFDINYIYRALDYFERNTGCIQKYMEDRGNFKNYLESPKPLLCNGYGLCFCLFSKKIKISKYIFKSYSTFLSMTKIRTI